MSGRVDRQIVAGILQRVLLPFSGYVSVISPENEHLPETSAAIYQSTKRNIPEDLNLYQYGNRNLKYQSNCLFSGFFWCPFFNSARNIQDKV
jgi:hypothetical protein